VLLCPAASCRQLPATARVPLPSFPVPASAAHVGDHRSPHPAPHKEEKTGEETIQLSNIVGGYIYL